MSYQAIHTLLEDAVSEVEGLPLLQRENTKVARLAGKPWSRFTLLPAPARQFSLGVDGYDEIRGIAQVGLFYPINSGVAVVNEMADTVIAAFPRGTRLTDGTTTVAIYIAYRGPALPLEQYLQVPISIEFICHSRH